MADVNDDRGQLLLVAAVGLAILFVTLALVMNTVIYTENLATRSSKVAGGSEAVGYRSAVEEGIGGLVTYGNYHQNTTHADLESTLRDGVSEWSDASGKLYAQSGAGSNVSVRSIDYGTRIRQEDPARDFENSSSTDADWTLASNVDRTRAFRINVTTDPTALDGFGPPNDEFTVVVDDGTDTWRLNVTNVTNDGGTVRVGIENTTGSTTCSAPDEPWINVTAGTVGGAECEGLDFAEGMTTPYEIRFENGDDVTGTYELIVTNDSLAATPSLYHHVNDDDGSGSPYVTPAVYSTRIGLVYQSPRLYFNTSVRVVPGEDGG